MIFDLYFFTGIRNIDVILPKIMSKKQYIPTELGEENVGRLLVQYAAPAIVAMIASSVYNIVDSIFVG